MPVIKRYANRKLYDTQAKQYVTLEDISHKIRRREEIQVIDNVTGEDITAITLSQIIFEQEKKAGGYLPRSVLTNLIQVGSERLSELHQTLFSRGSILREVDEEIRLRVAELVRRGELLEAEGQHLVNSLLSNSLHIETEAIERAVIACNLPTRGDLEPIHAQLADLDRKLEELSQISRHPGE